MKGKLLASDYSGSIVWFANWPYQQKLSTYIAVTSTIKLSANKKSRHSLQTYSTRAFNYSLSIIHMEGKYLLPAGKDNSIALLRARFLVDYTIPSKTTEAPALKKFYWRLRKHRKSKIWFALITRKISQPHSNHFWMPN